MAQHDAKLMAEHDWSGAAFIWRDECLRSKDAGYFQKQKNQLEKIFRLTSVGSAVFFQNLIWSEPNVSVLVTWKKTAQEFDHKGDPINMSEAQSGLCLDTR